MIEEIGQGVGGFRSDVLSEQQIRLCLLEAKCGLVKCLQQCPRCGGSGRFTKWNTAAPYPECPDCILTDPQADAIRDMAAQVIILRMEAEKSSPKPRGWLLTCEVDAIVYGIYSIVTTRAWSRSNIDYNRRIV